MSTRRQIWFDIPKLLDAEPAPGDYLISRYKNGKVGTAYLILKSRGVRQRKPDPERRRYMLEVERQAQVTTEITMVAKWWLCWNPRVKTAPPVFLGFQQLRGSEGLGETGIAPAFLRRLPAPPASSLDPRFGKPRRAR